MSTIQHQRYPYENNTTTLFIPGVCFFTVSFYRNQTNFFFFFFMFFCFFVFDFITVKMPVYSKLLSAVALVALVVSGGAVNMNLRSNVARSAPFEEVGAMARRPAPQPEERRPAPQPEERRPAPQPEERRPAPQPEERRPAPKPEERRRPEPVKETRRPAPKPKERRRPEPVKDTRRREPVKETRRPEPAKKGPTGAEIYQNKLKCNQGCKAEFKKKKESCPNGGSGRACRKSNNSNKQDCLKNCKA